MTLYVARGLEEEQIKEGLKLGLYPQLIIKPSHNNYGTISRFYKFVKDYEDAKDLPMKITTHGKGDFVDSAIPDVDESLKAVVKLNERAGRNIVKEVNFHAGAVLTHGEVYKRIDDEFKRGKNYSGIDSTFSAKECCMKIKKARENIKEKYEYGKRHGLDVTVENVGQVNFATRPFIEHLKRTNSWRSYFDYIDDDQRWVGSPWIPEPIQLGDFGCAWDMVDIMPEGGKVCIDTEHIDQTIEYSEKNNFDFFEFQNIGDKRPKDRYEKELLEEYDILVRKGMPVLFKEPVNVGEYFYELDGKIKISHLGGQTSMFYIDKSRDGKYIRKIGSHMPITFEDDPNEFILDDVTRRSLGADRRKKMRTYIHNLKKAGCEDFVLETHIENVYSGPKWRKYLEISRDNVKRFL